jgi:hypothetical protein
MKQFRKSESGLFICEECSYSCKAKRNLTAHINKQHSGIKNYYEKWLKESGEGKCKFCGNKTLFNSIKRGGYYSFCSNKCNGEYGGKKAQTFEIKEKRKQTNLEKYGVENVYQADEIKNKIKIDNLNKHNVEYNWQRIDVIKKSKQTKINKYGDKDYNNSEKAKKTCLEKYGVESYTQTNEYKEKTKKTCLEKYGVFSHNQNFEIHKKQQHKSLKIKKYKNTDLWYQGSYELDFLEKYYWKFPYITRGPTIKYFSNNKMHYYFPDFFIPSLNLVVEIKSSYYYKKFETNILEKEKATIFRGFNYIIIIDKDYTEFNLLFS